VAGGDDLGGQALEGRCGPLDGAVEPSGLGRGVGRVDSTPRKFRRRADDDDRPLDHADGGRRAVEGSHGDTSVTGLGGQAACFGDGRFGPSDARLLCLPRSRGVAILRHRPVITLWLPHRTSAAL